MTAIKEIIDYEFNKRTSNYKIIFFKEGDWYRAYQWSAYLAVLVTEKNGKQLNPVRKIYKNGDIVCVGLKLESSRKYFNFDFKEEGLNIQADRIEIDVEKSLNDITFDNTESTLNNWIKSIPLTKDDRKLSKNENVFSDNNAIMMLIKEYPLATKTLIENTVFLGYIQNLLLKNN